MAIADLYLSDDAPLADAPRGALPGIESAARYGERSNLTRGWRAWLAGSLGLHALGAVAPARIAAVAAGAAAPAAGRATAWIATPLHLSAYRARTHLGHGGIIRLAPSELAALAEAFEGSFGSAGFTLRPLPSGEFLLETPGIAALATPEPARWAGGDVAEALPRGADAAPLRRFLSEIEMWLHGLELNEARRQEEKPAVTTLWPWGAQGDPLPPGRHEGRAMPRAFGSDAYLSGLWRLLGAECCPLPERFEEIAATARDSGAVVVMQLAAELGGDAQRPLADAVARLDARFIAPALEALRRGRLAAVSVLANDRRLELHRRSHLRLWRRGRAGFECFA